MSTKPKTKQTVLDKLLVTYKACDEAIEWAKAYKTTSAAWKACTNPQWMLWALEATGVMDDKKRRLFSCWCVRNTPLLDGRKVWDLLTDKRSRKAVEVAERFADGRATEDELNAAWGAANAAWGAAYAARGAADAARGAADAAWGAAKPAWEAADAAWGAAYAAQCDQIRKIWPSPLPKKTRL